MLRGRRSCAISERPQTLALCLFFAFAPTNSFASPSCKPFSPNSFISPTYAKTGGYPPSTSMTKRSNSGFPVARSSTDTFFLPSSLPSVALSSPNQSPIPLRRLCSLCGEPFSVSSALASASRHCLELSSPNCQMSAKIAKSAYITSWLSITIINNVGAPTFLHPAPPLYSFRLLLNSKLPTENSKLSKSNHSRTSGPVARKSNHSRTYAKQGVGVVLPAW